MKKYIKLSVLFFIGGVFFGYSSVFASMVPWWDSIACEFSGTIESVSFEDEYHNSCLDEKTPFGGNICPTDIDLHRPARYSLGVKIESVSSIIKGETGAIKCEDVYKVGDVGYVYINKDKVKVGDIFSVNQKIEGISNPLSGVLADSYTLKTNKKSYKDTPVDPKTDKQIYTTNITKKGKLFFFIPISLNLQITIDLNTGIVTSDIVKETKKPWWHFLVKF